MPLPTSKRVCAATIEEDKPPEPTTPIDDFDDIYDDSPVIGNRREERPPQSIKECAIPPPNPRPQSKLFQLPGLGLCTTDENDLEKVAIGDERRNCLGNMGQSSSIAGMEGTQPAQSSLQTPWEAPLHVHETQQEVHSPPHLGSSPPAQNGTSPFNMTDVFAKAPPEPLDESSTDAVTADIAKGSPDGPQQPALERNGKASKSGPDLTRKAEEDSGVKGATDIVKRYDDMEVNTLQDVSNEITNKISNGIANEMPLFSNANVAQADQPQQPQEADAPEAQEGRSFEEVAEANKKNNEAEFELDSSPMESSSDSNSDSSSSSSGDSDYEMLDPAEEARRLMQEDGGSDDEGKGGKDPSGPLRTLNEKPDEIVPKPQIVVTPEMTVSELGRVEHVVENSILIKGNTSGESRALESGSLLCLEDRSVVGVIAELLGQVHQPYYSVRFTNPAAIADSGISKGISVFYVEQHSSYVFTQSLKALKGSDASNMHDEEVGDDELEFSDDEAEAEHKRRAKHERQARRGDREERGDRTDRGGKRGGRGDRGSRPDRGGRGDRSDGFSKGPRGGRGRGRGNIKQTDARETSSPLVNYDDHDDGEDLYTPLARPLNLHEIMGRGEAPQEDLSHRFYASHAGQDFQRGG
ncbi:MAG: hypothetical protein Q9200_007393, partial [Gallowayella weberi]